MFNAFKLAIQRQFNLMKEDQLFRVRIDKNYLWEEYLNSFPPGTNPKFRERTEHDCQCCRNFIRDIGDLVSIKENKLISIWDIKVDNFYQTVADTLSKLIKSQEIESIFLHYDKNIGTDKNTQKTESGIVTYNHFHIQLPNELISNNINTKLAQIEADKNAMMRSLQEITLNSVDTVIDLIDQNSLYRGEEHKFVLESFRKLLIISVLFKNKDLFCWSKVTLVPTSVAHIRNSVIGSPLIDLSNGVELERAINSFESKVAPMNYKRPTAPITKAMIDKAQEKIIELGYLSSLNRRFATLEDITINNVLFADRQIRPKIDNVFDQLSNETSSNLKFDKVEEIGIDDFIKNVLPKATSLELMLENRHANNLVSLIAPQDLTSKTMFKWHNNFSWSYNGGVTDSIKEKVKRAGGNITGALRYSISWFNYDDLDAHADEPNGFHIYYHNKRSTYTGGTLDVDMNAGSGNTRNAVENIVYPNTTNMKEGIYRFYVHNFTKRENVDCGFEAEIEFNNSIHSFSYPKPLKDGEIVEVATIQYTRKYGFKILKSLPSSQTSKIIWNIPTQTFHKVSLMMLSPNYWDEKTIGNKHFIFILDKCISDDKARGFFNEYLSSELDPHRKVFEIIGSKLKIEPCENQLSGLGFSSTQRNSVLCKVTGSFTRTLKIIF